VRAVAVAIVIAASSGAPALGESKQCTRDEAMQAEATASSLVTWPEILSSFEKFGHCDDGAIAEGYSSAIVEMLANRWQQIGELDRLLSTHPRFRAFVLRHVDVTAEQNAFNRLVANAAVRCPGQSAATCKAILKRAGELQRELQQGR
jgi:hypothetical protein